MSVAELLQNAKRLEAGSFEKLYRNLTALRIERHGSSMLSEAESDVFAKINREFDPQKWERLQYLDWKLEFGALTEPEEAESLQLAEDYERFSVERVNALSQLALLRQISLDDVLHQLGIAS